MPMEEIPFVLDPGRIELPLAWRDLFGRDGPVEVEIGSGKGLFLVEASRLRPESGFIGVERAGKWFHRAVERVFKAECANVRLLRADAFDFLDRWVPPESLAALHIYFPDPWPKKRHARRRMLREPLYRLGARALAPGAALYLASDVEPYFTDAVAEILGTGLFQQTPWPEDSPDRLPTNYARKYQKEGRALHYAKFLRLKEPPLPRPGGASKENGA